MASNTKVVNLNQVRPRPLANALGATKDHTSAFLTIKNRINQYKDPAKRFQPTTNVIAFESFGREQAPSTAVQSSNGKQAYNISTRSSSQSSLSGMQQKNKYAQLDEVAPGKNELPPLWVDIQESLEDKISNVDQLFKKLKNLRTQRFKPKFDDNENHQLDYEIDQIVSNLTTVIKESEKELRQMMGEKFENGSDIQIRKNIQQTYLFKLQDVTRQLRQMEKEHLMRVKDLYGEDKEIFLDQFEKREQDFFADLDNKKTDQMRNMIQLDHFNDVVQGRSEDISQLVNQINELAVIFKELSTLVIEQGTVLDRIDYNIEEARQNVKKGNTELVKTLKRDSSTRARGCMGCQITSILICLGLLMMKHMILIRDYV